MAEAIRRADRRAEAAERAREFAELAVAPLPSPATGTRPQAAATLALRAKPKRDA